MTEPQSYTFDLTYTYKMGMVLRDTESRRTATEAYTQIGSTFALRRCDGEKGDIGEKGDVLKIPREWGRKNIVPYHGP